MNTQDFIASIIVVCYNEEKLIYDCVESVLHQDVPRSCYEVIVVDNASTDSTPDIVMENFPSVNLVHSKDNLGYPAAMNLGLKYCRAQKVIMLSADTVVPPTWLQALLKPFENDPLVKCTHAAMVIPGDQGYEEDLAKRVTPARAAYHDMSSFGLIEPHWVDTSAPPIPTLHIAGANTALDVSILKELGGYMMDGDFFLDCDEIDLGFRVNSAGYKVLAVPAAAYFHRHPFNTAAKLTRKSARRLLRLERNKALVFYKNLHALEWLASLPIYFIGGAMKPLVYARRYSLPRLIMMMLGLELFIWLGFLNAATKYFPKFAWKRKLSLQNRRQPRFWFIKQLAARPALENLND